ncbi:MAG: hypothetical protein HW412_482 [Bacteroidetes bacterium]|nr:hypothetical protein [Bacteroidota bacterium]
MKKIALIWCAFVAVCMNAIAQPRLDTLRHIHPRPGTGLSAIWGYTAPNGREYALVGITGSGTGGTSGGTSIVDITVDAIPRVVTHIVGPNSTWREIKTYKQYAYVVTEASTGGGVQIIDLSLLPDTARLVRTFAYSSGTKNINRSHTITITDGFMYLNGCAGWSPGGILIFDLRSDPLNPQFVSEYQPQYAHDSYVLRDTIYASAINTGGGLIIADARNKASVQTIGRIAYTGSGTHNAWVTKDRRYALTADEIGTTPKNMKVWDIGNLPSIPTTTTATFTVNPATSIHNVHVRGDFAYCSWYNGYGLQIANISNPASPTLAAGYNTSGGSLAWETYPYFPSGKVIIGDGSTGLWIFRFTELAPRVPVALLRPAMNETTAVASPITFRWTKSANLSQDPHWYDVRLTGPSLDTTWRANDSITVFSALGNLQSGSQYTWYVTTRDEFNNTRSPQTFQFFYGTPTLTASITVTAPNGSENWQYNTMQNITWTSTLVDSVNISYETSPGGPWVSVVNTRPAASGTYAWTIPNAPSSQARVRIVSTANGTVVDSSNNVFSILVPGMAASPTSVNFGNVGTGQSRRDTIRISNNGTATLNISSIASDSAAFTVSRTSFSIPAGGSDTVSVFFRPTQLRAYTSTLRINGNAPTSPVTIGLSGMGVPPVSVAENGIPIVFALLQNYPNPFNPTTVIRYDIPASGLVTLRLYNLLGQQVEELVNGTHVPGRYNVTLDATRLPSGIYFYSLTAGRFIETKKLVLLR